jgi:hypothetical protein
MGILVHNLVFTNWYGFFFMLSTMYRELDFGESSISCQCHAIRTRGTNFSFARNAQKHRILSGK